MKRLRPLAVAVALAALLLAGCSGGGSGQASGGQAGAGGNGSSGTPAASRPSSSAKLTIDSPRNGQVVRGTNLKLKLGLQGAKIVPVTTTKIRPDQGHVHVLLDGKLISMNYALSETLPKLQAGTHVIQVEFVAADHQPFDPRVLTQAAFQVNG